VIGRVTSKRIIKRAAGWAARAATPLAARRLCARACIFVYHRTAEIGFVDGRVDDWNVAPDTLERQIAALAECSELVPLEELAGRLHDRPPGARPLVCLTFDDGYASFLTRSLPILKRFAAPATISIPTAFIGRREPLPFDAWSRKHRHEVPPEAWRAMDWDDLETCLASGLVTVASHSHTHPIGSECSPARLADEVHRSGEILRRRLGEEQGRVYVYPYGCTRLGFVPPPYVAAVRAAGYRQGLTTDLGLVTPESDPHLLPRVEAHALDVPAVIRAKALGALGSYYLVDQLRSPRRAR